ncbi:MAG: hypothetical protein GEU94_07475 [Micromonosporaceae bacterium]|nr:hypothetical protein [Micromonosporaceae bacterium]
MTSATVTAQTLGDMPWLVLRGERLAVFRALGEHARADIRAVIGGMPELTGLRRRAASPAGAETLRTIAAASRQRHPREWAELAAIADGAGVALDDLLLLNLRGDLGDGDGTGCTDLAYVHPQRAVLAHNEDGSALLDGRCALLTLVIDGDEAVTTWWYPGFIPANTFVLTGHGLVWGIDHLTAPRPAEAPGRHFLARALQRCATLAEVVERLTRTPTAGGFAYTIGRVGHPEAAVVEAAAGRAWTSPVRPEQPFCWHTNHARNLPDGMISSYPNSEQRGSFLAGLAVPEHPSVEWFLDILAGAGLPHGVLRTGEGGGETVTLGTFAVDLLARQATLLRRGGTPVPLPVADLLAGRTRAQA